MQNNTSKGADWLGKIPERWELSRIGAVYKLRNTKVSDYNYPPLSVTMNGIVPQLETAAKTNAHDDRKLVKKGDFAINSRSDRRGSCGIASMDGSVSLINTILEPLNEMNPRYYNWLFHSTLFADEFYKWGHGIVDDLWTTGWQEMKKIMIPFPPLPEQKRIADFLDAKCAEIDALTADIEKQIEVLEQYKRSIIAETVVKGIDSGTEKKDSGVEWIGTIPLSWTVLSSKYVFHEIKNMRRPSDIQMTASVKYGIISQEKYRQIENFNVISATKDLEKWKHVEPYDFVISLMSFKSGIEMSKVTGCVTWHYIVLRNSRPICPLYYKWLFKSSVYCSALSSTCNFIRNGQDLRFSNFAQVPLPVPPLTEQRQIADYLEMKCTEIDKVLEKKTKQLASLNDYKKSIIYEYVTGKKEVL